MSTLYDALARYERSLTDRESALIVRLMEVREAIGYVGDAKVLISETGEAA